MNIGELFITLGVDDSKGTIAVKNFTTAVASAVVAGQLIVDGLEKAVAKFEEVASAAMEAAMAISSFELQTGLSGQEMQKWDNVARQTGMGAGQFASNVKSLQKNLEDIKLGFGNTSPFMMMGINPMGQNPFQILEQMRAFYARAGDKGQAVNLLEKAGINEDMIMMLSLSKDKFEELANVPTMSPEQVKIITELSMAFNKFNAIIRVTMGGFLAQAAPMMINIFGALGIAIKDVTWIINQFIQASTLMQAVIESLLLFMFRAQIGLTIESLISNPISQAIAIIVGLFLLIDDIVAAAQGRRSIIGLIFYWLHQQFLHMMGWIQDVIRMIDKLLAKFNLLKPLQNALKSRGSLAARLAAPNIGAMAFPGAPMFNVTVPITVKTTDKDISFETPTNKGENKTATKSSTPSK